MSRTVSLVTANLFTHDGSRVVLGGMERYTRDLALLCQKLGFEPIVRQFGITDWEQTYEGFTVKAYPWNGFSVECVEQTMKADLEASDHVIYMWLGSQRYYKPNSITISHGIWFDRPLGTTEDALVSIQTYVEPALKQAAALVTVDLSFLEFCRCIIPRANNNKMIYIPNYVDTELFTPGYRRPDGMIEILYPRRYDPVRGIFTMQAIVPNLLKKYPNIRFNFAIDQNWPHLIAEWQAWLQAQPDRDRILYHHYPMDEMPNAYRSADIVVIPSLCSEGTSLSALEAMACGKAMVCSNVGGLANIVLPNFNGKIVNPTPAAIQGAIEEYIHSEEDRVAHGANARLVAKQSFSKQRWEKQWTEVIRSVFGS